MVRLPSLFSKNLESTSSPRHTLASRILCLFPGVPPYWNVLCTANGSFFFWLCILCA